MSKLIIKDNEQLEKEPQYETIDVRIYGNVVISDVLVNRVKYKRTATVDKNGTCVRFDKVEEEYTSHYPEFEKRTECSCEWTKHKAWRKDGLRIADAWTRKYVKGCMLHSK